MSEKKVKIRIDKKGEVHFEVEGVQGAECTSLTDVLMQNLGEVEEQQYTNDYTADLPDYIEAFDCDE